MISKCISDDMPPQMKILNMVIPILMHFCSFVSNLSVASCIKLHVIQQNVTLFLFFDVIRSDVALQKQLHYNCLYNHICLNNILSCLLFPASSHKIRNTSKALQKYGFVHFNIYYCATLCQKSTVEISWSLTLNAPIATKVVSFLVC